MAHPYSFVDAQLRAEESPDTFEVPPIEVLEQLGVGWAVKICADGERFWVVIDGRYGEVLRGTVASPLVRTAVHGLKRGDTVELCTWHIFDCREPMQDCPRS